MALLSFLMAHWASVIALVLIVLALGAFAWFARNWKVALAAVALVAIGLVAQQIDTAGYKRRVAEENQAKIKLLTERAKISEEIADAHMARAEADATRIEELEKAARDTPKNDAACIDRDGARRVRDIQ